MWRDKAATWECADELGGPPLVEVIRTRPPAISAIVTAAGMGRGLRHLPGL